MGGEPRVYKDREGWEARRRVIAGDRRLAPEAKAAIATFDDHLGAEGLCFLRRSKYLSTLRTMATLMGSAFPEPTKADVDRFLAHVETEPSEHTKRPYSDESKEDFRKLAAVFYRYHLNRGRLERGEESDDPPQVRWLKGRRGLKGRQRKRLEDLPTPEDVAALVRVSLNPRNRALLALAYWSGCRASELLRLRWKHVQADEVGLVLFVDGKTGARRVRIPMCDAVPLMAQWRRAHPLGENQDAPVFVGLEGEAAGRPMNYAQARKALRDALETAGIAKRVTWHRFRHARATALAAKVSQPILESYLGWTHGSKMPGRYIHFSGAQVDQAILAAEGQAAPVARAEATRPSKCPRCTALNEATAKYCGGCGGALSVEAALEADQAQADRFATLERRLRALEAVATMATKGSYDLEIPGDLIAESPELQAALELKEGERVKRVHVRQTREGLGETR